MLRLVRIMKIQEVRMTAGIVGNPKKHPVNLPIDMNRGANAPTPKTTIKVTVNPVKKQ